MKVSKIERRERAREREKKYRSPEDQLNWLDEKKFRAEKERKKLNEKIRRGIKK